MSSQYDTDLFLNNLKGLTIPRDFKDLGWLVDNFEKMLNESFVL